MEIRQRDGLTQHATYSGFVDKKNTLVQQAIDLPTAEGTWDLTTDMRGRPLLTLRVWDQTRGQVSGDFAPEELSNDAHLLARLRDLRVALLQVGLWRGRLERLYADIRLWCQGLPGGAVIREEPIVVREERSGEYEVSRLLITCGGQTMRVEPVAAWVVGAEGRVDLKGPGGSFTLLFTQQAGGWVYLPATIPATLVPLTETLFRQLSEACLNG